MRPVILFLSMAAAHAADLRALYKAHQWAQLRDAVRVQKAPALYRGLLAGVYGEDRRAERILLSVIGTDPHSEDAYEAHEGLAHLYFRTGQYRKLIANMERRWAAFPDKSELKTEREVTAGFRDLPDQTSTKARPSRLPHDPGEIYVPITINKIAATYFFDTGAWVNCMSDSEAKRLGLAIHSTDGKLGTGTGAKVGFRTAVAPEVTVGDIHYRNVSFAVFPDDQEPWSELPPGRRGLIGIPIILGFRTLHWDRDGSMEIGGKAGAGSSERSNLFFDDDHLAIAGDLGSRKIRATLDTGAETTDLYQAFAKEFATLTDAGKKDRTEVRGVGHAENFDSITIEELKFQLGGMEVTLRPAHVLLKPLEAHCCVGNFGMDLLKQGRSFTIDFGAMRLDLEK